MKKAAWIIAGIIMLLAAFRSPVLNVVGNQTTATVTEFSQYTSFTTSYRQMKYRVFFSFTTSGGSEVYDYFTRSNVQDISTLPPVGSKLTVRYFPVFPQYNITSLEKSFDYMSLAALVFGIGAIISGLKLK